MVAFTTEGVASSFGNAPHHGERAWALRLDWDSGATTAANNLAPVELDYDFYSQIMTADIAYDWTERSMFVVSWHHFFTITNGLYAARLGFDGLVTEGPLMILSGLVVHPAACVLDGTARNTLIAYGAGNVVEGRILEYANATPTSTPVSRSVTTIVTTVAT